MRCKYHDEQTPGEKTCNYFPFSKADKGWNIASCPAMLEICKCPTWWRRWYYKIRNWYLLKRYGRTVTEIVDKVEIYDPRYGVK